MKIERYHEANPLRTALPMKRFLIAFFLFFTAYSVVWAASPRDVKAFDQIIAEMSEASSPIKRYQAWFPSDEKPGTIIVRASERRLYLILGDGWAMKYGIGVAREGFEWSGEFHVSMKRQWPDWTPPPEMIKRQPDLPKHMEGGPDNPLGARALYLGDTLYRIHGSNEPETIGQAVSSGCIRMANEDVIDLYNRVRVGTKVIIEP
jgi:lipoprotein-anchoring transpeptidase ErfK/SrfK